MSTIRRPDQLVGRTLGDFVLRERMGEGGFGVVYRASQPLLDREAVIKVLHAPLRSKRAVTDRFLREARLASKLDHPYAAHIYAFGAEPDGELWIAMELVRGTPLDQLLKTNGPISLERFVPLFERMCEVVHTAHEQGIIHRDIKPANVMVLSRAGRLLPKLLDFGIAKALVQTSTDPSLARTVDAEPADDAELGAAHTLAPPTASDLTQRGAVMGSPPYMAPEQWLDAASVDARTDLYALAVLAYETLTGRLPFSGPTLSAIALAHAKGQAPPLGDGFPRALDPMFATAFAKQPEARFTNALVMAEALRAGSGIGEKRPALPMLEDSVRERALSEAPQPVAEAVAAFEAARNPHQARDAIFQLTRTLVRYVGLLAIAARTRIGASDGDAASITDALRELYRHALGDQRWLELARDIVRPFVTRRDAFPVPELIDVFFDRDGKPAAAGEQLDRLVSLRDGSDDMAASDDAKLAALLERGCADASRLLRELALLFDYSLVMPIADGLAERWMGVRRTQRATMAVRDRSVSIGGAILVDKDGVPALTLAPLVQIHAPAPGSPVELFLFEGRGRQGAKLVALPFGFEHHDDSLWDWFRAQLSGSLDEAANEAADERPPYRGLSAFSPEDAAMFFGREKLVDAFLNRLRVHPLLAVVGRSGAGKSSFVQAGVIPSLPAEWRTIVVRPGFAPFAALAARLHHVGIEVGDLRAASMTDAGALGRMLRADASRRGPVLLVIDQLEELFTLCDDEDERCLFAEAQTAAARSADDPVRVVFTLRDDFLVRAEQVPALRNRLAQGLQLLTVPVAADLLRILVEPARRAGYDFEDPDLPAEMVREVADQPGALALVSFTALKLWESRDRHFHQLTRKAYRALGGVGGALAQHAETTLEQMPTEARRLTREAFRHLVTSQNTRAVTPRKDLFHLLGGSTHADAVIESLIAARLVVASETESGEDDIEIVHEALLSAWPRLVMWRREDQEGARFREQLRSAARQWDERGRPRGLLWRGEALAELDVWRAKNDKPLTPFETAFVAASVADAARGRRARRTLLVVAFAALATALVVFLQISRQEKAQRVAAAEQRQRAESLLAESWEDQGVRLVLGGDSLAGLVFLNAALQAGRDHDAVRYALARGFRTVEAERATFTGHVGAVWSVAFSPDGKWLVSGGDDGNLVVWDVAQSARHRVMAHGAVVRNVAFITPELVASGGDDRAIRLWNVSDGKLVRTLVGAPIEKGAFATIDDLRSDATGTRLLSTSASDATKLWDVRTGALLRTFPIAGRSSGGDLSTDGTLAVVATGDRGAEVWDLANNRRITSLAAPPDNHDDSFRLRLRLSPRRDRVLTIGWNEPARLWDAADGHLVATLDGTMGNRNFGEFDADGSRVVTTGSEQTVKTWNSTTGALIATMRGHSGAVNTTAFTTDGTLASGAMDGVVRFWDPSTGVSLATHAGHDRPVFAIAAHGDMVASGGWDGSVRLYARTTGDLLVASAVSAGPLASVAVAADDRTITVGAMDGRAIAIDASNGKQLGGPHTHKGPVSNVAIAHDGTWVSAGADGVIIATAPGAPPVTFGAGDPISSLAVHPVEPLVVVTRTSGQLELWNLHTRARIARRSTTADQTGQVLIHPDGKRALFYVVDVAAPIVLWEWAADRIVETTPLDTISHVAFHRDGRIAVATEHGVTVLDASGNRIVTTELPGAAPQYVAFRDESLVVACADSVVRLVDARGGVTGLLKGHAATVSWADFVPGTHLVVSAGGDSAVRVWNATNMAPVAVLDTHGPVMTAALSSTGTRVVAIGMGGRLTIWDLSRDMRAGAAIAEAVRCRVPRQLREGRIVAVTLPTDCH